MFSSHTIGSLAAKSPIFQDRQMAGAAVNSREPMIVTAVKSRTLNAAVTAMLMLLFCLTGFAATLSTRHLHRRHGGVKSAGFYGGHNHRFPAVYSRSGHL